MSEHGAVPPGPAELARAMYRKYGHPTLSTTHSLPPDVSTARHMARQPKRKIHVFVLFFRFASLFFIAVFLLFAFAPGRAFQVKSIHLYSILLAVGLLELWGYPWEIYD